MTLRQSLSVRHGLLAAALSFTLAGCTIGSGAVHLVSVTYQYGDQNRSAADEHALLTAQSDCYLDGFEYAQPVSSPNIVSGSEPSEVTKTFRCIGLRN